MTKTQQELTAYLECDNAESRSAAGIALLGVGYERGARMTTGDYTHTMEHTIGSAYAAALATWEAEALLAESGPKPGERPGVQAPIQVLASLRRITPIHNALAGAAECIARFVASGALLFALAMPASAAKVPCPSDAPAGSTCYLVVRAPQTQCKGKTKAGARCTRTVGVDKRTGLCAQHKGQVAK